MMSTPAKRFAFYDLENFSHALLVRAGLPQERATPMVHHMLGADLLGHRTHGLWFMSAYLERIKAGHIFPQAELEVIHNQPNAFAWHAHRAPGAWAMHIATEEILKRVGDHGVVSATLADCSHIGCLQTYLLPIVRNNLLVTLNVTNPGVRSVAPFGGIDPVLTTNPIAWGIPTRSTPILVDQCTSIASNTFFKSLATQKQMLPEAWLLDSDGWPTTDPAVLQHNPPGSILPLGGLEQGYKGFGLGLMVEAFSLALGGSGRRQSPDMYGQGVFIQVIDPDCFAGRDAFLDEMDNLVTCCKESRPRPNSAGVRLPGERALALREQQLAEGITLSDDVLSRLVPWAEHFDIAFPDPIMPKPLSDQI